MEQLCPENAENQLVQQQNEESKIDDSGQIDMQRRIDENNEILSMVKKPGDVFGQYKKLGEGTYGVVEEIEITYKNGKTCTGALKTMRRTDPISGFGNLPEIEMNIQFGGYTFVPEVLIVDIPDYRFKPRNGAMHDEFITIATKKAHCDGVTFSRRGGYTIEHVLKMAAELFSCLKYIHSKDVCHRDIKPGNLLIYLDDGVPRLNITDFGLGCYFTKVHGRSPNVNTAWYRAPEIVWRKTDYRCNSDIWSAACSLYELATGKILFQSVGEGDNVQLFFETQLTLIPTEWTPEAQTIYRYRSEFEGMQIFNSSQIRRIEQPVKSFMTKFRSLSKYRTIDEPSWQALDKILIACFEFNYKIRPNASDILSLPAFESQRTYINKILSKQERPHFYDNIFINTRNDINELKVNFFREAYQKFVLTDLILSPRAIFHAVDLANIFITKHQSIQLDLNNIFSSCLYFYNKIFCPSSFPALPEKLFWRTYNELEVQQDERKLRELDRFIFDFERIVITKHNNILGLKSYRTGLYEIQECYNHELNSRQLRTLFDEYIQISNWDGKSYRYMYRFLYRKLFDPSFPV
jgi:serine/threonine protein kinase